MKRSIIFFCIALAISMKGQSQAQSIDATLAKYATDYVPERAYLHYDKAAYAPGETIWFKVYLMETLYPAESSKTIYIDWIDEKGGLLSRNVSPIIDGTTNGQFNLPADYKGRFVHVRAYTKWMLNFDSAFFYNKDIRVLQPAGGGAATKPVITPMLEFFPEGGEFIASQVNKIAFKANDQWGRPVKIKGLVQNSQGTTVDTLRVQHDGMGFVYITPKAGEVFTAKWKDEKGTAYTTALPVVNPHGVGLQVSIVKNKRYFQVTATNDEAFKVETVNVIGTMSQNQVFKISKDIRSGEVKGVIPTQELPSGILTITVFDEKWKALAERITYINNEEYLFTPSVEVTHWGLNKRARNDVEITVPDSLVANFSVSLTDAGIETDSSDNIISHLQLTGEIRGQVYNPAYYFSNTSDSITRHLDLVMLTHGWRRFKWDEVVQGKYPAIRYPRDTSYFTLSGRIYGAMPTELKDNLSIILFVKQKDTEGNILMVPVQPNGTFNENSLILFDTATIYYQFPKQRKLSDVSVKFLEGRMGPLPTSASCSGLFFNSLLDTAGAHRHALFASQEADLLRMYEGKLLDNVVVKSKLKSPLEIMDQKYASGMFSGGDGYQFDLVNDPLALSSMNIFTYLQGRVAGLQVNNATSGTPSLTWRGGAPQLYLNEMQGDAEMVSSIPVSDVAYIKVFRPPFMGGFGGANGAIAIYTKKGGDVKSEPGKGMANNVVTGYSEIRQFYAPNYSNFKPENERRDIRTTLFWNPQLSTTPQNHKVSFTFYNNDVTKAFRLVLEGMTKDGKLTRLEQILE